VVVCGRHQIFDVVSVSCSRAVFALYRGNELTWVVLVVLGDIISYYNNLQIIFHIISHLHTLYDAMLILAIPPS